MLPQLALNLRLGSSHTHLFLRPSLSPRWAPSAHVQTVPMRILLPPSEAKRAGGDQPPIAFGTDPLGRARRRAATALAQAASKRGAAAALSLPARSAAAELAADREIRESATMPGLLRYNGIVYDGLDVCSLPAAARRHADDSVMIFSGLWGVVRADELIPNYRLAASTALPKLGVMATYWRPILERVLPDQLGDGLVVDLRSSDYAAMWRPGPELAEQVVTVRVLSSRPGLPPAVISYPSKLGKGQLARALVQRRAPATRPEHVVDAWRTAGGAAAEITSRGVDLII
jgi:uncharacterized protein